MGQTAGPTVETGPTRSVRASNTIRPPSWQGRRPNPLGSLSRPARANIRAGEASPRRTPGASPPELPTRVHSRWAPEIEPSGTSWPANERGGACRPWIRWLLRYWIEIGPVYCKMCLDVPRRHRPGRVAVRRWRRMAQSQRREPASSRSTGPPEDRLLCFPKRYPFPVGRPLRAAPPDPRTDRDPSPPRRSGSPVDQAPSTPGIAPARATSPAKPHRSARLPPSSSSLRAPSPSP